VEEARDRPTPDHGPQAQVQDRTVRVRAAGVRGRPARLACP
jgi:hypothetical protein